MSSSSDFKAKGRKAKAIYELIGKSGPAILFSGLMTDRFVLLRKIEKVTKRRQA